MGDALGAGVTAGVAVGVPDGTGAGVAVGDGDGLASGAAAADGARATRPPSPVARAATAATSRDDDGRTREGR
ncbi:hypothetical protein GCM10009593_00140 [Microlunatus antarcticus]